MRLVVNANQLSEELTTLSTFNDGEPPGITRVVFSDADLRARQWLDERCEAAGLSRRCDAIGNTFYRWKGSEPELSSVATGSHIDAIPHSGMFDGTVGVLGGLEAIRALQHAGHRPRRSIELVLFTSEEPTRFGIGCLGSRLLAGALTPERAEDLIDATGKSLRDWGRTAGFEGALETIAPRADAYAAFVELHIEQGPMLEQTNTQIGVVRHIAAPASLCVTFHGEGGHAGAVLMPERRDAFLGAAEFALAVEAIAKETTSIDSVATAGSCQIYPGAVNSIPSRARLEIDVRDVELARRDGMVGQIRSAAQSISRDRRLEVDCQVVNSDAPASCDSRVVDAIKQAAATCGYRMQEMVSRAYHDTLFMARIAPVGMIFIPCRRGYSHRPEEYASPEAIAAGVLTLAETLAELAAA